MDSPLSIFGGREEAVVFGGGGRSGGGGGVCVQGMVSPTKAILRGAESLLGKIQWLMAGLREAEKPPAKSYELFLSAKYIFFEDCRAIRALLLPFKLFLCCG